MNLNLNSINAVIDKNNFEKFFYALTTVGTRTSYKKNEVAFTEGGKADFILIVEEGVLRTWRLVNDEEIVLGFTFPGNLETSPISFLSEMLSKDTIDAVCDTVCLKVSRKAFFEQLHRLNLSEDIILSILLEYIDVLIQRNLEAKAFTAEENYIKLLMGQPKLVNKIPLKDVASFLGISKERLSRIRKKHDLT